MHIDWFNLHTKTWNRTKVSCSFTVHGELFGAHKHASFAPKWTKWTVSHVATGLSVLNQGFAGRNLPDSRAAAIALAKASLEARTGESVKAAIERGREKLDEIIAEYGPPPTA
jgi:hypothetical protein